MATFIKKDNSDFVTYENQPESTKTLFKNDTVITSEDVRDIVISVLNSLGIIATEDSVIINKNLYAYNELDEHQEPRPVLVTTADPAHAAGLLATWSGTPNSISITGKFGGDSIVTKIINVDR